MCFYIFFLLYIPNCLYFVRTFSVQQLEWHNFFRICFPSLFKSVRANADVHPLYLSFDAWFICIRLGFSEFVWQATCIKSTAWKDTFQPIEVPTVQNKKVSRLLRHFHSLSHFGFWHYMCCILHIVYVTLYMHTH